jgi:uncharacterized protein (DUF4415 family)
MDRKQQLEKLKSMKDEDIDFSDLPEIEDGLTWRPNPLFKPLKAQITAKLDKDIVMWLKLHGDMTKFLNQLCRDRMMAERTLDISTGI